MVRGVSQQPQRGHLRRLHGPVRQPRHFGYLVARSAPRRRLQLQSGRGRPADRGSEAGRLRAALSARVSTCLLQIQLNNTTSFISFMQNRKTASTLLVCQRQSITQNIYTIVHIYWLNGLNWLYAFTLGQPDVMLNM